MAKFETLALKNATSPLASNSKLSLKIWNFPLGLPVIARTIGNFKKLQYSQNPVILLLHNLKPDTSGARWYPFQIEMGKLGIPSIAPDFPGFGLSSDANCSILEKGSPLLADLLSFLDLKKIIIIGEGIGAALALEAAKLTKDSCEVLNVILMDPSAIRLTSLKELKEKHIPIHIFADSQAPQAQTRYTERVAFANQEPTIWTNQKQTNVFENNRGQLIFDTTVLEKIKEFIPFEE